LKHEEKCPHSVLMVCSFSGLLDDEIKELSTVHSADHHDLFCHTVHFNVWASY